jgi:DNA-binding transcriptional regulator YdaS (Cro superfamily)
MDKPILKAIQVSGGQAALARRLTEITGRPFKQQNVWNWIKRGVPAEMAIPLEQATGGRVTRNEMRPDLYPLDAA